MFGSAAKLEAICRVIGLKLASERLRRQRLEIVL
jgi:hypothetical protein